MTTFEGIAVYTIEKSGCLNGIYTNNSPAVSHSIYNESARLQVGLSIHADGITGTYDCTWVDLNNAIKKGELSIKPTPTHYDVYWKEIGGKAKYSGIGFLMRPNMFVVRYNDI